MRKSYLFFILLIISGCAKKEEIKPDTEEIDVLYSRAIDSYSMKDYDKARALFSYINRVSKEKEYRVKSIFYLGEIYRNTDEYNNALKAYVRANYYGIDCSRQIKEVAPNADAGVIVEAVKEVPEEMKPYLLYLAGKKYQSQKKNKKAEEIFKRISEKYSNSLYARKARFQKETEGDYRVGVILPLTGKYSDIGNSVRRGIEIGSQGNFVPLYINTGGNPLKTYRAALRFIRREKVSGIIGPVFSLNSFAIACLSDYVGVPMISPTATEEVIDSLSDFTYVINRSLTMQAEAMADYAVKNMGLKKFSIMYPSIEYGKTLQEKFEKAVKNRGGIIINKISYRESDPDFKDELKLIKKGNPDAIYIPARTSNISIIAPQIKYFKIKSQILGADGWYSDNIFNQVEENYLEGVVLTAYPYNPTEKFMERYRYVYKKEPDRNACLGYDAARLMNFILKNPGTQPLGSDIQMTAGYLAKENDYSRIPLFLINNGTFKKIR